MNGIIIQARVRSLRLSNKVLKDAGGYHILGLILARLESLMSQMPVLVATSTHPDDSAIVNYLAKTSFSLKCFQGDEQDVLNRILGAANLDNISSIVRICADSPWVDPLVILRMLDFFEENQLDLLTVDPSQTRLFDGIEIVRKEALEKILTLNPTLSEREHVTLFIKNHTHLFKMAYFPVAPQYQFTQKALCVDSQEDFKFFVALLSQIESPALLPVDKLKTYILNLNRRNHDEKKQIFWG